MRALSLLVASAVAFGVMPFAGRLGLLLGACLTVSLGVLLALAASHAPSAVAVTSGALGAFSAGVLAEYSAALAGALLVGLAFAERTLRVRDVNGRLLHLGVALGAGAVAGTVSTLYAGADPLVRGVVVVIAAVLGAAPLLIPADDPIAHALDDLASSVSDPSRSTLRAGAELRRNVDESLLDSQSVKDAQLAWRNLVRLGRARVRLDRSKASAAAGAVMARVDQRLAEHVASLTRMYTAADSVAAATLSLDDGALSSVAEKGATLDEVSSAIVDEVECLS